MHEAHPEALLEQVKYIPDAVTAYQTGGDWSPLIDEEGEPWAHADEVALFHEESHRYHKYYQLSRLEIEGGRFLVAVWRLLLSSGDAEDWERVASKFCDEPDYLTWRALYSGEACERLNDAYIRSIAATGDDYLNYFNVSDSVAEEWIVCVIWTTHATLPGKAIFKSASSNHTPVIELKAELPQHVQDFLCLEYDPELNRDVVPWRAYEGDYTKLIGLLYWHFMQYLGGGR